MPEQQIKSKKRVADHGEVFTAEREVNAMDRGQVLSPRPKKVANQHYRGCVCCAKQHNL